MSPRTLDQVSIHPDTTLDGATAQKRQQTGNSIISLGHNVYFVQLSSTELSRSLEQRTTPPFD